MIQRLEANRSSELLPDFRQMDLSLNNLIIANEINLALNLMFRSKNPGYTVKLPRRFLSLESFRTAIFMFKNNSVYLGDWDSSHYQIAKLSGNFKPSEQNRWIEFVSGYVFRLRINKSKRIIIFNATSSFKYEHLENLIKLNYLPMDTNYNWILPNGNNFILIPSSINKSREWKKKIKKFSKEK